MADNERVISTVFKADISNFTASTQQLNRYVSQVNSEFKDATASMTRWNDNTDGLKAKITQLNGVLDAEKTKLKKLEEEYNALSDEQKKNTRQGQELATAVNNQRAAVKETTKNIDYYSQSLKDLEDAGVKTRDELNKINKELDEQKAAAKELGGNALKGAAAGVAGFGAACVGAMAGLNSLVEETKELRTQMGQLETSFTQQGHSVAAAEKTYAELYGVLGDSGKAAEASLHLGQLAKTEKELNDYTSILTGVYATFGDTLPVEGLAEAMNHTANLGSVQGVLADALEWSGINVDDFNAQLETLNTEEERAALINSTLNGIYGETSEQYKEVNKDVIAANEAQNEYNQAIADIAEKAQPAITSFKTAMVGVLQTVLEKFNEVDIAGLVGKISGAITSLVDVALPPLMTGLTWILDNANWLVPVLGSIVGLIAGISAGIKIYNGVVTIAKAVQLAWNVALNANPIGLIITAIGLLVTAFVVLWNKCEGFRNFFINMWNSIKAVMAPVIESIGNQFIAIMNIVKGVVNGVIGAINVAIRAINKIKVNIPDWVPEFGGKTIGFNLKEIPMMARGAIVDKPTLAMVGEAGKEAVMPLENNTQWIDKLAARLKAKGGNKSTVNNFNYTFNKMETTELALHKAKLETKRILKEA